jgi:hypothetical protein
MESGRVPYARHMAAFCLCMVSAALQAQPTHWSLVSKSGDGIVTFYKDAGSVTVARGTRLVRLLYDYQQIQQDPDTLMEHRSTIVLVSADCRNHRLASVQSTDYAANMGKGKLVVKSRSLPPEQLHYISVSPSSGSVDDKIMKSVCGDNAGAARH